MRISIIVPVLNEAAIIGPFLRRLRERAPEAEIILVDGGSSNETMKIAEPLCDRALTGRPNRAVQMNAGARVATGDAFLFLHADVEAPTNFPGLIRQALQRDEVVGGFFRIRIAKRNLVYRLTDGFSHYAGLALRIRCGDHGFFCRRRVFETIGGFPEVELMEDADFFRQLRRVGTVVVIPERIVVSPRRFESIGPLRLNVTFGLIALLYFCRAPRRFLQLIYERACGRRS